MMIKGPLVCSGRVFDIEIVKHFLKFKENKCIHKDDKKMEFICSNYQWK